MRLSSLFILCLCAACLPALELRPNAATIYLKDGKSTEYAVFHNNVDKVLIGQSLDDRQPASNVDWERIDRVEYADSWRDRDYLRGLNAFNRKKFAEAVEYFTKSLAGKSEKLQVESHLALARAQAQLKDYAAATRALQGIIEKFPRHRENINVMMQIGHMHLAAGHSAEAASVAERMDAMKDYKPAHVANAAMLRAAIAKASGKNSEAIATIKSALGKVNGEAAPDAVSALTSDILGLYLKEKQYAEVLKLGQQNQWWPHSDPDVSASIHLSMARAAIAEEKFEDAFHHAAIAATAPDVSGSFNNQAKDVAKEAVSGIKGANEDNDALINKYRKALGKL